MKFGGDKGFVRSEARGGDNDDRWVKNFRDGETEVRFLEQMDQWTPYWEHFDQGLGDNGSFFPCTGDRSACPGCTSDNDRVRKASKKYLVNALARHSKDDKSFVNLFKVGIQLAEDLEEKSVRDEGDLFKRMYYVIRKGKGLDTKYLADRDDHRDPIDPEKYRDEMQDHEQALQSMWKRAFGEEPDEPRETRRPREERVPLAREVVEDVPARRRREPEPVSAGKDLGDPPSEPQRVDDQAAEANDEVKATEDVEVTLTEEELRAMSASNIKVLIRQCGFEAPSYDDSEALADFLLDKLGV